MSMQVYQMAVMAEHRLATKPRWAARDRRSSLGKGFAKVCGIAALALTVGLGFLGDEAAAWSGSGRGTTVGTSRATIQTSGTQKLQATAATRYGGGGGALATRR
jgi:hypothetical protein